MNRKNISFIYRIITVASLSIGIFLSFWNTSSIVILVSYYTSLSNICCWIVFTLFMIGDLLKIDYRNNQMYYLVKGTITIVILITAIVYQIALAPNNIEVSIQNEVLQKYIANLFVHIISPILVVLDYFLFDVKGNFKYCYLMIWSIIPFYYVPFVYLYHAGGGEFYNTGKSRDFAYIFLDYHQIGYKGVFISLTLILIMIVAISYLWVRLDHKLANRQKKIEKSS